MADFVKLTVDSIDQETDNAVVVNFSVPASLSDQFQFSCGQYVTLKTDIAGEEVRRSYSICAGEDEPKLQIAIKHVVGGLFSTFANEALKVGGTIDVLPPAGSFTCALNAQNEKRYLCIAAGSGITPVISIVKSILAREPRSHVTLLYGNQRVASIMFREELEQLKNRYMSRLQLIHILSRESRDTEILNGRINNKKRAELAEHLIDIPATDEFFLCGPEAMISEISRGLRAAGIDETLIHYELFGRSADDAAAIVEKHHERARRLGGKTCSITVKSDGRETSFELRADGENMLDAAMNAGLDLPYACKGGVCATCKAKLVEGEIDMDINHALEADEVSEGYILSCQAHPVSDNVIIDFDAAR